MTTNLLIIFKQEKHSETTAPSLFSHHPIRYKEHEWIKPKKKQHTNLMSSS